MKSLLKEIITESAYFIKRTLIFIIIISLAFLLAFAIGTTNNLSTWLIIIMGIIFLIVLFSLYAIVCMDFKKPFCKIPITATITDTMTIRKSINSEVSTEHYYIYVLKIEYKYNNKIYKKKIEVNDGKLRVQGAKINIMICKSFPKIMYIIKNNK